MICHQYYETHYIMENLSQCLDMELTLGESDQTNCHHVAQHSTHIAATYTCSACSTTTQEHTVNKSTD